MGFSVLWGCLHGDGVESTAEVLALVDAAEGRGSIRTLCWQDLDEGYREASEVDRRSFLDAYSDLSPGWDPDVDYGDPNLHVEVTDEGKAEWRRRHPLEREHAWKAEGIPGSGIRMVWAIDEQVADSVAGPPPDSRIVEPATFELRTGDVVDGVKVTYTWLNPDATTPNP